MSEVVLTTDSCRITDRLQCRMTKRAMGPKAGSAALRRGLLWTFAFLMSTAAASVYLGRLLRTIGPLLVILTSFFGLSFFFFATQLSADRSFARIWGRAIAGWH